MSEAFLNTLPKWVNSSVSLVSGKGVPTVTYMTSYQMKRLGVGFGGLNSVKMSTIQNFETILQLEKSRRAGIDLDLAILQTHSVQYAETSIIQSGHQITGAHLSIANAAQRPVGELMRSYEIREPALKAVHDALLSKYGMQRSDNVLLNFSIKLDLAPLSPGQAAPVLRTK